MGLRTWLCIVCVVSVLLTFYSCIGMAILELTIIFFDRRLAKELKIIRGGILSNNWGFMVHLRLKLFCKQEGLRKLRKKS